MTTEPYLVTKRPNSRPLPRSLVWGIGGLVLGAVLMFLALLFFAPQPRAAVPQASSGGDITVTLDDAALTQVLGTVLRQTNSPIPLSNLQAHIIPGNEVIISGDVVILPGTPTRRFVATTQLYITQGHLAVHLTNASIGGTPALGFLTTPLETLINEQLAKPANAPGVGGATYRVTGVSTQTNRLTLTLTT